MNKALRWRIMTLQTILVLALGFVAGFLYWGSNFATSYVHDQLVAQKIFFPPTSEIKTGGALDPAEFPASIRQYAGTQVDTGDKAKEYANNFIGKHLESVVKDPVTGQVIKDPDGNTMTYATLGTYISQQKAAGASASSIATLNTERDTLFKGEMLRSALLNAWGWSQVGLYAGYAAIAMTVATIAVFLALVFETVAAIVTYRRKETEPVVVPAGKPVTA